MTRTSSNEFRQNSDSNVSGVKILINDPSLCDIVEIALRLDGIEVIDDTGNKASLLIADLTGFNSAPDLNEFLSAGGRILLIVEREEDIVKGTEYLVVPKHGDEILLDPDLLIRKVREMLSGHRPVAERNPVTGLPGEPAFEAELFERIKSGERFGVLVADINQFRDYNKGYSYARGDKMLQAIGELMANVMARHHHPQNFLSHLGSDDFAIITSEKFAPVMAEEIVNEFDEMVASFYDVSDLARGYLIHTDRKGNEVHAPLATVAIAAILSSKRQFTHPAEVLDVAEELIRVLKNRDITESCCITERPDSP